jgi:glycerate 2-kinase
MSQVKGGKFAQICAPAEVVSIIFSDVLGNDISTIASGPTVAELPSPSKGEGFGGEVRIKNILIASNIDALEAMEGKAEELGFNATIETDRLSGDAIEVGKALAAREFKPKTCILFGGETTLKIPENHGEGGRNQAVALSALPFIKSDTVLICVASDGFDNTPHAGAIAHKEIFEKSQQLGLNIEEFLQKSDSYNFWEKVNGAISTGRLESNVSDLVIMLYK